MITTSDIREIEISVNQEYDEIRNVIIYTSKSRILVISINQEYW